MAETKLLDQPANADGRNQGLTIRQYACIALKLPLTGDHGLDRLIGIAQRRDLSLQLLSAISQRDGEQSSNIAEAIEQAERLVETLSRGKSEQPARSAA